MGGSCVPGSPEPLSSHHRGRRSCGCLGSSCQPPGRDWAVSFPLLTNGTPVLLQALCSPETALKTVLPPPAQCPARPRVTGCGGALRVFLTFPLPLHTSHLKV